MNKIKPFSKLTKAEKRVRIAKDAIKQLNLKVFISTPGRYVNIEAKEGCEIERFNDLKSQLPNTVCEVCAKGALFIAEISERNNISLREADSSRSTEITKRLNYLFSKNQLDLIETAYELTPIIDSNPFLVIYNNNLNTENEYGDRLSPSDFIRKNKENLTEDCIKAIKFGNKYRNDTNRLLAILENIIKNKGEFRP